MHMQSQFVPTIAISSSRISRKIAFKFSSLLMLAFASLTIAQTCSNPSAPSYGPYKDTFHHGVPAWSPGDREIIYSEIYTRRTAAHLLRVASNGGESTSLFPGESFTAAAAWSPDAKHIAFSREMPDGTHIWISDTRGKELHELAHSANGPDLTPAWSPNGNRIAYTSVRGTTPEIMVAPTDGTPGTSIGTGFRPRFSPDGSSISYTAAVPEFGSQKWAVYIKQIGGGKPRMLTSSKGLITGWPSGADWSPDGRQIVFVRHVQDGGELLLIDVNTDRVDRTIALEGLPLDPAWSHDGRKIAFMLQTSSHQGEIQVVQIDTDKVTSVTRQKQHVSARLVSYPALDGQSISAYLYEPAQKNHCGGGLLWIHGGEPAMNSIGFGFVAEIQYFADNGFTVMVPDFRPGHESSDIHAAAVYLHSSKGIDAKRIGLVGLSFGGYLSLLTASKYPGAFAAVVDFFGPTDLAALYHDAKPFQAAIAHRVGGSPEEKPEDYNDWSRRTIVDGISSPVLILHGTSDEVIPIRHSIALSDALQQAGKPVRFVKLTSGHGFSAEDDMKAFPEAAAFLRKYLRSGT